MRKKLLAIIAAAAMVVTMIPAMAFAAPATTADELQAAFNAGGEVTLNNDITVNNVSFTVPAGVEVKLDLNGKKITGHYTKTETTNVINNKGTLTIVDSAGGSGIIELADAVPDPSHGYGTNTILNNGKLTIVSGTIKNNYGGASYTVDTNVGATTTIEGGTIINTVGTAARVYSWSNTDKSTLIIKGGELIGGACGVLVHDLNYSGTNDASKQNDMLVMEITGGEITATAADGYALNVYAISNNITISGGDFNGYTFDYAVYYGLKDGYITGGTFSSEYYVTDYLASGYEWNEETGEVIDPNANIEDPSQPTDKPENPTEDPSDDPTENDGAEAEKAEDAVDTGDNMNMAIPFAIAGLALAVMAAVVVTRRRFN